MLKAEQASLEMGGKQILSDVDLTVTPGEFICLLGPNGAGKSSLVQLLTGERQPSRGLASLDGRPISNFKPPGAGQKKGRPLPTYGTVLRLHRIGSCLPGP